MNKEKTNKLKPFLVALGALVCSGMAIFGFCNRVSSHEQQMPQKEEGYSKNHWVAPPDVSSHTNPIPRSPESNERGKQLFLQYCVGCHGPSGRGDGPAAATLTTKPADLVKMAGHHSDGDIAWKIANGRDLMPAWKSILNDHDIWDLTNFIQSLGSGHP